MSPVCVAGRVFQPAGGEEGQCLDPLDPALAPVAAQRRIGRAGLVGQHLGAPVEVVGQQAAAHVVDVVRMAVHGGAAGDDRLQRRRAACGELQPVEPAPGDPDHPDVAVAPRLARDPGDDCLAVRELLLRVLVVEEPVRIPGAGDVDPDAGVAGRGEHRMGGGVARRGPVALAVGQVFQDGGGGPVRFRPPQPGREPASVRERDPGVGGRQSAHRVNSSQVSRLASRPSRPVQRYTLAGSPSASKSGSTPRPGASDANNLPSRVGGGGLPVLSTL